MTPRVVQQCEFISAVCALGRHGRTYLDLTINNTNCPKVLQQISNMVHEAPQPTSQKPYKQHWSQCPADCAQRCEYWRNPIRSMVEVSITISVQYHGDFLLLLSLLCPSLSFLLFPSFPSDYIQHLSKKVNVPECIKLRPHHMPYQSIVLT